MSQFVRSSVAATSEVESMRKQFHEDRRNYAGIAEFRFSKWRVSLSCISQNTKCTQFSSKVRNSAFTVNISRKSVDIRGCYSLFSISKMAAAAIFSENLILASFSNRTWLYAFTDKIIWRSVIYCSYYSRFTGSRYHLGFVRKKIFFILFSNKIRHSAFTHEVIWRWVQFFGGYGKFSIFQIATIAILFSENLTYCLIFEFSMTLYIYWRNFMKLDEILQLLQAIFPFSKWRMPPPLYSEPQRFYIIFDTIKSFYIYCCNFVKIGEILRAL